MAADVLAYETFDLQFGPFSDCFDLGTYSLQFGFQTTTALHALLIGIRVRVNWSLVHDSINFKQAEFQ